MSSQNKKPIIAIILTIIGAVELVATIAFIVDYFKEGGTRVDEIVDLAIAFSCFTSAILFIGFAKLISDTNEIKELTRSKE